VKESFLGKVEGLGTKMNKSASSQQKKHNLKLQVARLCAKCQPASGKIISKLSQPLSLWQSSFSLLLTLLCPSCCEPSLIATSPHQKDFPHRLLALSIPPLGCTTAGFALRAKLWIVEVRGAHLTCSPSLSWSGLCSEGKAVSGGSRE
jgi:hypothetical protein